VLFRERGLVVGVCCPQQTFRQRIERLACQPRFGRLEERRGCWLPDQGPEIRIVGASCANPRGATERTAMTEIKASRSSEFMSEPHFALDAASNGIGPRPELPG